MRFPQKQIVTLVILCLCFVLTTSAIASDRGITVKTSKNDADRRIALIIGNSAYEGDSLKNPANDAKDLANLLKKLGFQVSLFENLRQSQMKRAIDKFGRHIRNGGVGFFFFAGHGVQVNGRNFLMPIGAVIETDEDVEYECIDAGRVLAKMEAANNLMNIVILDACRDNPYSSGFRSGGSKGLASMNAPKGTIIAYAASPGQRASDGKGRNSPFTASLLKNIGTPGLDAVDCLQKVQVDVLRETGGKQSPWLGLSPLEGKFYFRQGGVVPPAPAAKVTQPKPAPKPTLIAGGPDIQADQRKEKISQLLQEADALLKAGKLTTPKGANALEKYNQVLFMQPLNRAANEGLKKIIGKYIDWAKSRLSAGDLRKAEQFLTRAEQVREGDERVLALRDELRKAKEEDKVRKKQVEDLAKIEAAKRKAAQQTTRSKNGRFIKDGQGIITDSRTGLHWLVGPDQNTTFTQAQNWVAGLASAGAGWRMPTLAELAAIGIRDARKDTPQHLPAIFTTTGWLAWSDKAEGGDRAWAYDFDILNDSMSYVFRNGGYRAFAVKTPNVARAPTAAVTSDKQSKRFSKGPKGIITDSATGLQWYMGRMKISVGIRQKIGLKS